MIKITLRSSDLDWAKREGARRLRDAEALGLKTSWPYGERSGLDTHTLGCMGELAFCRVMGLEWPARNLNFKGPDIDPYWEIRWASWPYLKVRPDDKDHHLCVLVMGQPPTFSVIGYMKAQGAKREPLRDPKDRGKPAHFIPANRLAPIEPGFHSTCGYVKRVDGVWICVFCGTRSDRLAEETT